MAFRQGGYGGSRGGGFNRGGGGGYRRPFSSGPREWTDITCAQCGKQDKVPFKPREGSEVLCKDCYMKKKGITPREQQPKEEQQEEKQEYVDVPSEEAQESCECEECGSGEEEKAEDSEEF